jgi:hypothetical protein
MAQDIRQVLFPHVSIKEQLAQCKTKKGSPACYAKGEERTRLHRQKEIGNKLA